MRSSRKQKIKTLAELINDPTGFASHMLQHQVWPKQREILQSVARFPKTAVKACHASGKTFTAAEAVMWWITTQPKGIAVSTAPTQMQVERLLWGEIRSAIAGAAIRYPVPTSTRLQIAPDRYAIGFSTNEGVRFQGFHGNVLVVIDEAPGVQEPIFDAIEGTRAGGDVRVLMLGNPVIASGRFHSAFTTDRIGWNTLTISAFDTPNLQGVTLGRLLQMSDEELDANPVPYLTSRRWVKEKSYEWGPSHQLWQSRVMGEFPTHSEDALLSLSWLEQAKLREGIDGEWTAGLDVAGPGKDETALCIRNGSRIVLLKAWLKEDARGDVIAALRPYREKLKWAYVDSVGIGWGMYQHLSDHHFPVRAVNVGRAARDDKYANLKAEIYWQFRQRAELGELGGLNDEVAIAQLATLRYNYNSRGQIVIESKEQARKRGVKSPDRAEAIILAFAKNLIECGGIIEYYENMCARLAAGDEL